MKHIKLNSVKGHINNSAVIVCARHLSSAKLDSEAAFMKSFIPGPIVTDVGLIRTLLRQCLMITLNPLTTFPVTTHPQRGGLVKQCYYPILICYMLVPCTVKKTTSAVLSCRNCFLSHQVICVNANNVAIDKLACDWSVSCSPWAFLEVL